MDKQQAEAALVQVGISVLRDYLYRVDEDSFIYVDWRRRVSYTVVGPSESEVQVHKIPYEEQVKRDDSQFGNGSEFSISQEFEEAMSDIGYCPECLQPSDVCTCPDDWM